jgi:hypothetical protein
MATSPTPYPLQFSVDYPDQPLNRLTTFFRIILVIPILIVLGALGGGSFNFEMGTAASSGVGTGGLLFLPPLLMILFRQKYPVWWYDWNLNLLRFSNRVTAYLTLLRDEYPSTDEEQTVHLEIDYPDARNDLNRWLPLVKWLLAIPHYIVLILLAIVLVFVVIIAWFAILFTRRYPQSLFDFVVGVIRWSNRVAAYAFILTTDRYPPFRFGP